MPIRQVIFILENRQGIDPDILYFEITAGTNRILESFWQLLDLDARP